jgi:hypothetical protein
MGSWVAGSDFLLPYLVGQGRMTNSGLLLLLIP